MAAEDLERTIEELNSALQAFAAAINPATAAQLEKAKADKEYVDKIKKAGKEAEDARKKALEKEKKDQEDRDKKITELAETGVQQFVKIFSSAGSAMYKGEKGMTAFNGSVDAAAGSLTALVGVVALLTGGGSLLAASFAAAIAGAASYVKAAAEQSDKLYDAFQEMSRAGAAGADGLQGVYNDMQKFGLGIQDLGKMTELLKSNSQNLALFGGTVFQGRKKFAELSKDMEPYRASLMNAGMTQDEINEGLAGYLRIQSKVGQTQNKTQAELTEGAHKYLLEQEALTKVTGMNRKDQEALREKTMSQERFAGRQAQLIAQGSGDVAKALMDAVTMIGAEAPTLAEGFADITAGNLTSAKAVMLYNATNGKAIEINEKLQSKQISAAQATDMLRDAIEEQQKASNATGQAMIGVYESVKGPFYETQKFLAKGQSASSKALANAMKQLEGQGAAGKKAADAELQRQTDMRLAQQSAMQNMQDFVRNGVEPATTALSWFGEVVENVTSWLPGAGKFREKMEAEKKGKKEREARAQEVIDSQKALVEAEEKKKAAITDVEKEAAEKNLEAAKIRLKTAQENKERGGLSAAAMQAPGAGVGATSSMGADDAASIMAAAMGGGAAAPAAAPVGGGAAAPAAAPVGGGAAAPAAPGTTASAGPTGAAGGLPGYAPPTAVGAEQLKKVRDLIGQVESFGGNYNVVVGEGRKDFGLTNMTIEEVVQLQRQRIAQGKNSPVGKYQFRIIELQDIAAKLGIPRDQKFDAATQDAMADFMIRGRGGFDTYQKNPTAEGKQRFLRQLATIWAGLPAGPDNQSYYKGVGDNTAHISWGKALEAFANGGMLGDGKLGIAGEAGPELIAGPASITSNNDIMGAFRAMNAELASQSSMLAEIARATKASSTANEKMLRVSMN